MNWPDLTSVLDSIPYAIIGGVATRMYMPERLTKDLDVVVSVTDAEAARQKLRDAGFKFVANLSLVRGSTWAAHNGQEVDVLEGEEHWWPQAIAAAQSNRDSQGQPVLTLPYLILMKYLAGRAQDLADIERMLGQADDETIKAVCDVFSHHAPGESDDLNSLIELARLDRGDQ